MVLLLGLICGHQSTPHNLSLIINCFKKCNYLTKKVTDMQCFDVKRHLFNSSGRRFWCQNIVIVCKLYSRRWQELTGTISFHGCSITCNVMCHSFNVMIAKLLCYMKNQTFCVCGYWTIISFNVMKITSLLAISQDHHHHHQHTSHVL